MIFIGLSRLSTRLVTTAAACGLVLASGCGGETVATSPADIQGQPVIFDFVERLPAARVFGESTFVDLGRPGSSRNLVTGWGGDEAKAEGTTYVWAVAKRAELDLLVFDTDATRLRFRAWPFLWEGARDQVVTVSVNGRTMGSTRLAPKPKEYSFRVPRGVLITGVNRVAFDFTWVEEARIHRNDSHDHRTLAAAFDFVGIGRKPEASDSEDDGRPVPVARDDALLLAPGTGLVYAFNRTGETTLAFTPDVDGGEPPDGAKIVVWSQRAGSDPVELLATDLKRVCGQPQVLRVDAGEGRLEIGFAVTGGDTAAASEVRELVVSGPRLHAEKLAGEKISNVFLVVVDTLRADRLGVYGSTLATPNIDRLAARGVTFKHAYSHIPITAPSHSSLFTSLIPTEHGVHNNGQILPSDIPVMAEMLRDDGRNTAGVVSLGVLEGRFGLGRGFDSYLDRFRDDWMKNAGEVNAEVFDLLDGSLPEPFFLWVHYSDPHEPYTPPDLEYPRIQLELNGEPVGSLLAGGRGQTVDLTLSPGDNDLRFVDLESTEKQGYRLTTLRVDDPEVDLQPGSGWRSRERALSTKLFMTSFPATLLLHNPGDEERPVALELSCQPDLSLEELQHRYGLEVEYVDREIGRLLDFMEERRLLENTLVIFVSDHGEGLGDHNHLGHISQLYNSLLHAALIMAYPGHLPEGQVVEEPVALVDVLPTVIELMGLESPPRANGVSLAPLMAGGRIEPRSIVAETHRPEAYSEKRALVRDGYKYIHSWTDDREWEELYDLSTDPGELRDLAPTEVERLAAMRTALQTRLREAVAADAARAELSDAEIERLRALGYIH